MKAGSPERERTESPDQGHLGDGGGATSEASAAEKMASAGGSPAGDPDAERAVREAIALSATAPYYWTETLHLLAHQLGQQALGLTLVHPGEGRRDWGTVSGFDPRFVASYRRHYHRLAPWELLKARPVPGRVEFCPITADALAQLPYYREWMAPQGLRAQPPLCANLTPIGSKLPSYLVVYAREAGRPLDEGDRARLLDLLPALRTAVDRSRTEIGLVDQPMTETLDMVRTPIAHLDGEGTVIWCNAAMRERLGAPGALQLVDGHLEARTEHDQCALRLALAALSPTEPERAIGLTPNLGTLPEVVTLCWDGQAGLIRAFLAPAPRGLEPEEAWLEALGLTPSERRVVQQLSLGREVGEIAEALSVRPNTVRQYLKRIFGKTGARGQKDLARLVSTAAVSTPRQARAESGDAC